MFCPNRILYGCDRTVASVSFHPVEIGRKGIFGQVQSIQNAPLFNQPREAQTRNSSNVLHQQDFIFYPRQTGKSRPFRQRYQDGGCFTRLFRTNCQFLCNYLLKSSLNLYRKGIFLRQFLKIYPNENKFILALLMMLVTNCCVSMYFLFSKMTKY